MNDRAVQFWLSLLVLGAAIFVSGQARAQESPCGEDIPRWRVSASASCPWAGSPEAACGLAATSCLLQSGSTTYQSVTITETDPSCKGNRLHPDGDPRNFSYSYSTSVGDVECPAGYCEEQQGDKFLASATGVSDEYTPPGSGCFGGCAAFLKANQPWTRLGPSNDRDWLAQYEYTGQECDGEPQPAPEVETSKGPEKCAVEGPLEYCQSANTGPGCGFVNDEYVCLAADAPGDKCFEGVDGSMICAEGTPTPPAPDSGEAGVKATPDGQLEQTRNGTTNTYNYYNSTTVNGSSRPPGGTSGDGDGDGTNEGACEGEDCGEEEGGGGDVTLPTLDEGVPSFGESNGTFLDSISAGPLATAVNSATVNVSGGQCPTASFPGWSGGTLTIDFHCELIDANAGLLAAIFTFLWIILAVRIFLSA